ncbi:Ig-like domain-containing protein [[Clostridium] polysaccharolyticum]|uniref:Ig-like domain (Group 2) n=1 Tax=[Clostridium] polysaccharolyticum TaxID=29364 RepID=A0A1I0BAN0_9FIRM|nr:Ig-like domain-containing protein [[Clostridium] polysaccharolyticum]SET03867.1 Ig-like domain (group 2) [[Clostridium] polysaccharolyticum]
MKKKCTYFSHRILIGILFFMVVFMFVPNFESESLAESGGMFEIQVIDEVTHLTTTITGTTFVMRSKTQVLQLSSSDHSDFESVTWSVASDSTDTAKKTATVSPLATKGLCQVNALKPGLATIAAEVKYKDDSGNLRSRTVTCLIDIKFAILEDASLGFRTVIPTDERDSLVMKGFDSKVTLSLNYGDSSDSNCTWTSEDQDVVTVENGVVTVVGAGRTTINASYLPSDSTTVLKDSITVYVVPTVKDSSDTVKNNIYVHSETEADRLITDTAYRLNGGSIKDKMEWVISTGIGGSTTIIEDSLGYVTSDLIDLRPSTPNQFLKTIAKAGRYSIKFFPKGVYEDYCKAGLTIDDIGEGLYSAVTLYVYGEFADKVLYVNKGDDFDVAQAFNVTPDVFHSMFSSTLESGVSVVSYVDSEVRGTALEIGDAIIKVKIDEGTLVDELLEGTQPADGYYTVKIHVSDGITLDRSAVTLALGAKLQLRETSGASDGEFTWESDNPSYVSVDKNGLIRGLQVTGDDKDVKITLTQVTSSGYIRHAVCQVRVVSTVTNIKLNYEKVNVEVDKTLTVLATFTPNVSTAPITWITNEEEIVSLSVSNDNKSVVVTGLKPGTAVISAVNTDNFVTASVTVTVVAPIKTIKIEPTQLKVKVNADVVKLKATYTPADATSNDLVWSSSNTAVAKVDENGVVTLVSAGAAIISVRPAYNPYLTMAQCDLTVLQAATGFSLDTKQLTLEAGQSQKVTYKMEPKDATTSVIWKTMNSAIATVSADGKITAVAPGKTYIVASTENGFSETCEVVVTKAASSVTLDVYNLKIAVGDTYQVIATPNPKNSTEKTFTWKSKDNSIATVNASGKVTGVKPGETVITVKTKSGAVEYLYVTVYNQITSMKLNYAKKTLVKGKKFTLKAIFTPSNATNKKVKWSSSNTKVASVTSKGVVSGLRGGAAVITAVAEDGGHTASCLVTVKQSVTSITLNKSSYTLGIGKTIALKAKVKSNYSSNQKLKWTSTNVRIATVSSKGVVKGKKKGTVTIKCKATDGSGEYAACRIHVVRQVTKITLNKSTIKMLVGRTTKIKAKVSPSSASYKSVKWSSSNPDIAQIDSNGNLTALSAGNCKIYAKAKDNSGKKAVCYVYVSKAVPSTAVTISEKDMVLVKGTSSMLAYSITPNNTTDRVYFSSDNKRVATVSSLGRVSARKPGAATITIRTSSGKVGMVNVTVVGLNRTSITMGQYERIELWVEEKNTGVRWYSENASIASVENGSVVSRMKGKTRIVAIIDGIRLYCNVTVR